jgi:hypothetical protein
MIQLFVDLKDQRAFLMENNKEIRRYGISSSSFGVGFEVGSNKTPTGKFKVHKKIGKGEPEGAVFRERNPSGEVCFENPRSPLWQSSEDLVLSRILLLDGCEPENSNTLERYIYIHGTNQEHLLGKPASHGCIRMSNRDVIDLFGLVEEGTEVVILG